MRIRPIVPLLIAVAALAGAQTSGPPGPGTARAGQGAQITAIDAAAAADAIVLTFESSDPRRDLLVFWGTAPFATVDDLRHAGFRADLAAGIARLSVAVEPGVDYWFAVLDAARYLAGDASIVPGRNATTRGVRLPLAAGSVSLPAAAPRGQPLPSLQLEVSVSSGRDIEFGSLPEVPSRRDVSPATATAIAELLRAAGPVPRQIRKVQLLGDEAVGGDAELRSIAAGTLAKGEWSAAERALKEYLRTPRAPERQAAARFYLGQAYWFQGRLRDAYFEFLGSDEILQRESRDWEDACLSELARG
jgi:hypothetical protein